MTGLFEDAGLTGRRVAVGIGVFDGVHRGHQLLLAELAEMARETEAVPVAMTFVPHPREVLCPQDPPRLLMPPKERLRLLRHYGAAEAVVIRFSPEFAGLAPEEFLQRLLRISSTVTGICVGSDWRFGAKAAGNAALLADYCREHALAFRAVPELRIEGEVVSSTAIRRAVASGLLARAEALLGRPYRLTGIVEPGYHAAGRELKRPTANLAVDTGILPPDGVYAARALVAGIAHPAAVNLGVAPTFGWPEGRRRLEVHVLDFSGNLYGMEIGVELIRHLRPERAFSGVEELRRQIEQDIEVIREEFLRRREKP